MARERQSERQEIDAEMDRLGVDRVVVERSQGTLAVLDRATRRRWLAEGRLTPDQERLHRRMERRQGQLVTVRAVRAFDPTPKGRGRRLIAPEGFDDPWSAWQAALKKVGADAADFAVASAMGIGERTLRDSRRRGLVGGGRRLKRRGQA
jgi:hypothetical protein